MHPFLKGAAVLAVLSLLTGCLGGGSGSDSGGSNSGSSVSDGSASTVGSGAEELAQGRVFLDAYPGVYEPQVLSVSVSGNGSASPTVSVTGIPTEAKTLIAYVMPTGFNYLEGIRKNGVVNIYTQSVESPALEIDLGGFLEKETGNFVALSTHDFLTESDKSGFFDSNAYVVHIFAVTQRLETVEADIDKWNGYIQESEWNEDFFSAVALAPPTPVYTDNSFSDVYKEFIVSMTKGGGYLDFAFSAEDSRFEIFGYSSLFTTNESLSLTDQDGTDYPLDITPDSQDPNIGRFQVSFAAEDLVGKNLSLTYHSNSGVSEIVGDVDIPVSLNGFSYESIYFQDKGDYLLVEPMFSEGYANIDLHSFYHESDILFSKFDGTQVRLYFDNFDTEWDFENKAWVIPKNRVADENNAVVSDIDWSSVEADTLYLEIVQKSGLSVDFEWQKSEADLNKSEESNTSELNESTPADDSNIYQAIGDRVFLQSYPASDTVVDLSVAFTGTASSLSIAEVSSIPENAKTLLTYILPARSNYMESFMSNGLLKVHAQAISGDTQYVDIKSLVENAEVGNFIWHPFRLEKDQINEEQFNTHAAYKVHFKAVAQDLETVLKDINLWGGYDQGKDFFTTIAESWNHTYFSDSELSDSYKEYIASMGREYDLHFSFNAWKDEFSLSGDSDLFTTNQSVTLFDGDEASYPLNISVPTLNQSYGDFHANFNAGSIINKRLTLNYNPESGVTQHIGSIQVPSEMHGFDYLSSTFLEDGDNVVIKPSFSAGFYSLGMVSFFYQNELDLTLIDGQKISVSFDVYNSAWDADELAWIVPKKTLLRNSGISEGSVSWSEGDLNSIALIITPVNNLRTNYLWVKR